MNRDMPERETDKGPIDVTIASAPGNVEDHPSVGIRNAVGLRP